MKKRATNEGLGRNFNWLLSAYAISTFGTMFEFGAFPIIAIRVLHTSSMGVSFLDALGLIAGAIIALPLVPWIEFHRKRPAMVAADIVRFVALASVPLAYSLGVLSYAQMAIVAIIVASANIAFTAASGALLKSIVPSKKLLTASGHFESTTWLATILGPTLGGAAVGILGPVASVAGDAISYILSAFGIGAIHQKEPQPQKTGSVGQRLHDVFAGWQYILRHPTLLRLFFNSLVVNGLIMAPLPVIAVLMLRQLGFQPWEYGLAFALPCIGGFLGARLAPRVTARLGEHTVLRVFGVLRACWPLGLTFMWAGATGLIFIMLLQFCLVTCMGIFNPVFSAHRLSHTEDCFVARTLGAWTLTNSVATAILTALWGVLANFTSPRFAIGAAGVLLLFTPLLLPGRAHLRPKQAESSSGVSGLVTD